MKVRLSGTLLRFAGYAKEVSLDAGTVGAALEALVARFPDLRTKLYDKNGNVGAAHRVFVNDKELRPVVLTHPVGAEDCVHLLTAVAGG